MICSAPASDSESAVLLLKPVDVWVKKGDVCLYSIMAVGNYCDISVWMQLGQNCTLTHDSDANRETCHFEHHIDQKSCRQQIVRILTFSITINDRLISALDNESAMQVSFVVSQKQVEANLTAQVHFVPEPEVVTRPTDCSTTTLGPASSTVTPKSTSLSTVCSLNNGHIFGLLTLSTLLFVLLV